MLKLELEIALDTDDALPSVVELLTPYLDNIDRFTFRTVAVNGNPEVKIWSSSKLTLVKILAVYLDCQPDESEIDTFIESE
jgi:hypothetical protein